MCIDLLLAQVFVLTVQLLQLFAFLCSMDIWLAKPHTAVCFLRSASTKLRLMNIWTALVLILDCLD